MPGPPSPVVSIRRVESVGTDRAPADIRSGVRPVNPRGRVGECRRPAPGAESRIEDPVPIVVREPTPRLIANPGGPRGRVIPVAGGIGAPTGGDRRSPDLALVGRRVIPLPVVVEDRDIFVVVAATDVAGGD